MESLDLSRRHAVAALAGSALLSVLPSRALRNSRCQPLPSLIKLVVGYSAGGPVDGAARLLAPALGQELGTQVIVDNRPGAAGSLGGNAVAKAPP
jgi:tripartite-type tricarboxylate transporter receptor subunit TctC